MKQLVTETRPNIIEVLITLSYPDSHPVFSKKEWEEMVDGENTYYWVEVANEPVKDDTLEPTKYFSSKEAKRLKRLAKRVDLKKLKQEKNDRVKKYRALVDRIDEAYEEPGNGWVPYKDRQYDLSVVMTPEDIESGSKLQEFNRKKPLGKLGLLAQVVNNDKFLKEPVIGDGILSKFVGYNIDIDPKVAKKLGPIEDEEINSLVTQEEEEEEYDN